MVMIRIITAVMIITTLLEVKKGYLQVPGSNVWWFLYLFVTPQEHSYIVQNVSCTHSLYESSMVNCRPPFLPRAPLLETIRGLDWCGLIIYSRCHMTSSPPANWEEQSWVLIGREHLSINTEDTADSIDEMEKEWVGWQQRRIDSIEW